MLVLLETIRIKVNLPFTWLFRKDILTMKYSLLQWPHKNFLGIQRGSKPSTGIKHISTLAHVGSCYWFKSGIDVSSELMLPVINQTKDEYRVETPHATGFFGGHGGSFILILNLPFESRRSRFNGTW